MARTRTTKKIAQRIDLNYFKRLTPLKRATLWLSAVLPLLALVWIGWHSAAGDKRVFSSGRMSAVHAVLEKECAACHVQKANVFSAKADNSACLACHDGPIHHADQTGAPACAECHTEHRGRVNIAAISNQLCAQCHADLLAHSTAKNLFAGNVRSFNDGHPQFAALRSVAGQLPVDSGTIKLNHAVHMKPIRSGPHGPIVQLECRNCHHATSIQPDLTYADSRYRAAVTSYKESDELLSTGNHAPSPPHPPSGRELMAPVKFADACASCHLLSFDKRFDEGVPHDNPEIIRAFLINKFQGYIATHPGEVRVTRDPDRSLTGAPLPPEVRLLTPAQWVAERTADAEQLLWRKTCRQCHTLSFERDSARGIAQPTAAPNSPQSTTSTAANLPQIAPARTTLRWMPHAKFDHNAHRGFACINCHEKALTSTDSSDVLLPGIATCQTCHAAGPDHAESRCFECHAYHDWSKRQEVAPKFILPALRSGQH